MAFRRHRFFRLRLRACFCCFRFAFAFLSDCRWRSRSSRSTRTGSPRDRAVPKCGLRGGGRFGTRPNPGTPSSFRIVVQWPATVSSTTPAAKALSITSDDSDGLEVGQVANQESVERVDPELLLVQLSCENVPRLDGVSLGAVWRSHTTHLQTKSEENSPLLRFARYALRAAMAGRPIRPKTP